MTAITKSARGRQCKMCKQSFVKTSPLQFVCSVTCAIAYANASKLRREASEAKKERKLIRERKIKLKTRQEWLKDVEKVFNQFIRLRDDHNPCISCDRFHNGQYHAGHYRSVGSSPHLRFNEFNCHKQCSVCNNHLSGNIINYRRGLIAKIGQQAVEQLEANQEQKHYTIDELIQLKKHYQAKVKEMLNDI